MISLHFIIILYSNFSQYGQNRLKDFISVNILKIDIPLSVYLLLFYWSQVQMELATTIPFYPFDVTELTDLSISKLN